MILMIDEEKRRMDIFVRYLHDSGFDVKLISDVDEALEYLMKNIDKVEVIILDIMMPWGKAFDSQETELGLLTGYKFYYKFRKEYGYKIPIIIYTALNRPKILSELNSEKQCTVFQKSNTTVRMIIDELNRLSLNK